MTKDGVYFVGQNSCDVTGSCIYIRFGDKQILLECGLHQSSSNSYLDSYRINSEKFKFNPSEINYVFLCHAHVDHGGLLPRLIREGFKGKIIINATTARITDSLLKNCAYILQDEARVLTKRYKREYSPIYNEEDVYRTLDFFYVYDEYNKVYNLDDTVSFKWLQNAHCVGAAQLVLFLDNRKTQRKILYTSDIGALQTQNHYVYNTEVCHDFVDVAIMESTYGNPQKTSNKTRAFDREHLRVAIDTVLERGGSLILPAFSFSRTQELLTELYSLFGSDKNFNTNIIVDSKLSCELCNVYDDILTDNAKKLWNEVSSWTNLKLIKDKSESQACIADIIPKIVITSSGFCTNGRIVNYLDKYLRDTNSMIVFSGYTGDNPSYLSYRIQNYKDHKTININKKPVPNRADCITMSTFSSHANNHDLVIYGSSLNTNKLVLVHGSQESKEKLQKQLQEAVSKNDKTYRVVCSSKDMVVHL